MFQAFGLAATQLFGVITVICAAMSSMAQTVLNLATVAEETSGQYKDQSRIDRATNLAKLESEHNTTVLSLPTITK